MLTIASRSVARTLLLCAAFTLFAITDTNAQTSSARAQKPPYSFYRTGGGLFFSSVSGMVNVPPLNQKTEFDHFTDETKHMFENLSLILKQAGLKFSDIINVTVYLTDMKQYDEFNTVYRTYFSDPFPARVCMAVKELPAGSRIEVSVIALVRPAKK